MKSTHLVARAVIDFGNALALLVATEGRVGGVVVAAEVHFQRTVQQADVDLDEDGYWYLADRRTL